MLPLLYLDQNYLSGMVKRKPAFRELEPVLRAAVARAVIAVPESEAHHLESAARPDLPLLELLRDLSDGLRLPDRLGPRGRHCERRLRSLLAEDFPDRRRRASDRVDVRALARALPHCRLITCDAFMAGLIHRTGLDVRFQAELFSGRRGDVDRLRERVEGLAEDAPGSHKRLPAPLVLKPR